MRTIIDLPPNQVVSLDEICKRERLSRAEVIRRAVAQYIQKHRLCPSDEAFGLWRDREVEGVSYQRKLRREWLK
jgi:metal-responsive CopG/Arc/MetJ family transcriptional regulator